MEGTVEREDGFGHGEGRYGGDLACIGEGKGYVVWSVRNRVVEDAVRVVRNEGVVADGL